MFIYRIPWSCAYFSADSAVLNKVATLRLPTILGYCQITPSMSSLKVFLYIEICQCSTEQTLLDLCSSNPAVTTWWSWTSLGLVGNGYSTCVFGKIIICLTETELNLKVYLLSIVLCIQHLTSNMSDVVKA